MATKTTTIHEYSCDKCGTKLDTPAPWKLKLFKSTMGEKFPDQVWELCNNCTSQHIKGLPMGAEGGGGHDDCG